MKKKEVVRVSRIEYLGDDLPIIPLQFKKIPDDTDVSADHAQRNALYVKDEYIDTYWYSGRDSGNLRLIFNQREWISIIRLFTWNPRRIEAKFIISGKEYKSDRELVKIGEKIIEVDAPDKAKPQNIDIDIQWNQYELIQIQCIACPVINQIEIT